MDDTKASLTALGCALLRGLHTRSDPHRMFEDKWGERLVPEEVKWVIRQRAVFELGRDDESVLDDWMRQHVFYSCIITRSRYTEDALSAAIGQGVRQYVLVGAGFDTYALRRPSNADRLDIYEIDHPATQALKIQQLKSHNVIDAHHMHFLPADLSKEGLDEVLSRSTFDRAIPAFFSWLGVSVYLTHEANLKTLRTFARYSAPGSELVFTYVDQDFFARDEEAGSGQLGVLMRWLRGQGEPFVSGFHPSDLAQVLRECGLELLEDLDDVQLLARYDSAGVNGLKALSVSRNARCRVI